MNVRIDIETEVSTMYISSGKLKGSVCQHFTIEVWFIASVRGSRMDRIKSVREGKMHTCSTA